MGEGFPSHYHQEMLQTTGGCPTIQLNSDSTYLEIASTGSTGEGISPTRLPLTGIPHFIHQAKAQVVTCTSYQLAINQRIS